MITTTRIDLAAIVVDDYDRAIEFFVNALGFELVEDSPSLTNDGRPKRWVVVRPPDGGTGILLARADGEHQTAIVGNQVAGRVGFFLRVDDFTATYERMIAAGVEFTTSPHPEPHGRVAVFLDIPATDGTCSTPPDAPAAASRPSRCPTASRFERARRSSMAGAPPHRELIPQVSTSSCCRSTTGWRTSWDSMSQLAEVPRQRYATARQRQWSASWKHA